MVTGRKWGAAPAAERWSPAAGLGVRDWERRFPEGMTGDPASAAELGLSQAAAAVIMEQGIPAQVEGVAPGQSVISLTGPSAPFGE